MSQAYLAAAPDAAERLDPAHVSRVIVWLASEAASGVTGRVIRVEGQWIMAMTVVRSAPSTQATEPMLGGEGWLSAINSENCQLVRPSGRSASSKRRASTRAARCR